MTTTTTSLTALRTVEHKQLRELHDLIAKARDLAGQIAGEAYDRDTYRFANNAIFETAQLKAKIESFQAKHTTLLDSNAPRQEGY